MKLPLFGLSRRRLRGRLVGRRNSARPLRCRSADQLPNAPNHGLGAPAPHWKRGGGAGAPDQCFGIGQHDRVVPRTLHDEWQLERRRAWLGGATSAAVPFKSSSRAGIDAEPASARTTAAPSIFTSSTVTVPLVDL